MYAIGNVALLASIIMGACGGPDTTDVYVPELAFPPTLTITEGGSTTFVLSTSDFSHGDARGQFISMNPNVTTCPARFDLSPSAPSEAVTVTAAADSDATNEKEPLYVDIPGSVGSPAMQVLVLDTNAENVIADAWTITLSPSGAANVGVRLSQPPSATTMLNLRSSNSAIASVAPSSMSFGTSDYNIAQTFVVTANATGMASIDLAPSDLQVLVVHVLVFVQ